MTEITMVLAWWITLQLFGLAVLPLTLRLLRNLPDGGWAFARPVGLLLGGFVLWHGATFGLLSNEWGSIAGALLVIAIASWLLGWREAAALPAFIRAQRGQVLAIEVLFTTAFLLWTFFRAHNPEISATEKPMELAFLNGVLRSEQFPPLDPWLSGYSISYYYFGYLIAAMVARLSGVPGQYAFNLMIPTLFALTATGAYAIGSALYAGSRSIASVRRTIGSGLLASVLVLALSNLEPVLEILNTNGLLSRQAHAYFSIKDMPVDPLPSGGLFPSERNDSWWWFRATRVIGTPPPPGSNRAEDYTISEFPIFSFVLGDMHPHVLALPFVFLTLALALNLLRTPGELRLARLARDPWTIGAVGILFGGLGFLNAWDMPTFLFVFAAAFGIHRVLSSGKLDRPIVREVVYGLSGSLLLSVLFYLPFYMAFRSQASGLGLVVTKSQLHHFLLFWAPLYALTATFIVTQLVVTWRSAPAGDWTRHWGTWAAALGLAAVAFPLQAPAVGLTLPLLVGAVAIASRALLAPREVRAARVERPIAVARRRKQPVEVAGGAAPLAVPREQLFALLMAFTGILLILGCELVFIRDLFGNRMNTVFKLYYQAWVLLALAGAFAVPYLAGRLRQATGLFRFGGAAWAVVLATVFGLALLYPVAATVSKARGFSGSPTLDGIAFWGRVQPDDLTAIRWLQENVAGAPVIVEASGPSYQQQFGRVSSMTGLPTLLGWPFHEQQWRGSFEEQGRRQPDLDLIYRSKDNRQVQELLEKYGATYLYVGATERDAYGREGNDLNRFAEFMDVAYKNGNVTIYRVRGSTA